MGMTRDITIELEEMSVPDRAAVMNKLLIGGHILQSPHLIAKSIVRNKLADAFFALIDDMRDGR